MLAATAILTGRLTSETQDTPFTASLSQLILLDKLLIVALYMAYTSFANSTTLPGIRIKSPRATFPTLMRHKSVHKPLIAGLREACVRASHYFRKSSTCNKAGRKRCPQNQFSPDWGSNQETCMQIGRSRL